MDYDAPPYRMICGSSEAQERRYKLYVGQGLRWLVADQENAADNIYVEGGPGSQGFAGRELTFKLVDGGEIRLKGRWHTNSHSLFQATGIDVRDKYFTFGAIGRDAKGSMGVSDVLYMDEDWTLGEYDRIEKKANLMAVEYGKLCFSYQSNIGGMRGWTR